MAHMAPLVVDRLLGQLSIANFNGQDNHDELTPEVVDRYHEKFPDMTEATKKVLQTAGMTARLIYLFQQSAKGKMMNLSTLCSGTDGVVQTIEDRGRKREERLERTTFTL